MKLKTIGLAFCGLMISLSACAGNDTRIRYAELPTQVKQFVGKYYAGAKVSRVMMDRDDAVPEFEIYLMDGTKIEVKQNLEKYEISNRRQSVPATILPAETQSYLKANYPNKKVVKIDKDYKGYEVTLENGRELEFNSQGHFIKID